MGIAIDALVHRHPMLRSLVGDDGMLRILPPNEIGQYEVPVLAPGVVDAERARMLRNGPATDAWPLFELALSFPRECDGKKTKLHVNLSLFLMDGFTEMILRFELASLYYAAAAAAGGGVAAGLGASASADASAAGFRALADAACLTPLDLTFRDYVCSMESMKTSPTYIKSMNYWLERLESLSASAELPLLRNVASSSSTATSTSSSVVRAAEGAGPVERIFHHHGGRLPQAQWEKIKSACAHFNVSATCLLLTIYGMSLARFSATKSFVVNVLYTMRHPVHADVRFC